MFRKMMVQTFVLHFLNINAMILVTTPTGKTGSLITKDLVEKGHQVKVFVRYPNKIPIELHSKLQIAKGSLLDGDSFEKALQGCDTLYFCIPETNTQDNVFSYYENFASIAQNAIKASQVEKVVFVSGGGKGTTLNAGVSSALHQAEDILAQSGVALKALRCPVFFESILHQIEAIKEMGMFFLPFDGNYKAPQVAVKDITQQAVKWLSDTSWKGVSGVGVHGAADISYNEIADTLSKVLQKPIRFQNVPKERYIQTLVSIGSTPAFATELVNMYDAIQMGLFKAEPRTGETTTPTTFESWAEEIFFPIYQQQ